MPFKPGNKLRLRQQPLLEIFESMVVSIPECGCWIWMGTQRDEKRGYGQFFMNKKRERAHRASWLLYNGNIPENMLVLHRCDTPACVNPHHLFLGTDRDNVQDCINKKRRWRQ